MVDYFCGRAAVIRCSWTYHNPGRRYYGCPTKLLFYIILLVNFHLIRTDNMPFCSQWFNCPFNAWFDPSMRSRSLTFIPGLLRSKNNLEAEVKKLRSRDLKMKMIVILILVAFVLYDLFGGWIVENVSSY
ncbi:uncharacterized protein [Rutidosis leptorrhynchoides]|uniref:uncharacterized protein n=1 Tax=Rutidosis leptorrhynchoides TaxID=125765 RepID=UPI003A99BA92